MPTLADISRYVAPVAATVAGGLLNRRAAGNATRNLTTGADAAMQTVSAGNDTQQRIYRTVYGEQKEALQPYLKTGAEALEPLKDAVDATGKSTPFSFDASKFWSDPNIQKRIEEGNKLLARKQAGTGSLRSGAAIKAARDYNDYQIGNEFDTMYRREEGTFRANESASRQATLDRINALLEQTRIGQTATGQQVAAGGDFARASANAAGLTSQQIADLETDRASALAMGDVAKANTITDLINGAMGAIENVGIMDRINGIFGRTAGPAAAGLTTAASLAGGVAAPSAMGVNAAATGVSTAVGGGGATGITGALGLGGGSGLFGLGALTIPVLGAGIAVAAHFVPKLFGDKKAQAAANELTKGGGVHDEIKNGIDAIDSSVELSPEQKAEAKESLARRIEDELIQFAKKDKHNYYKAKQTLQDFARWGFGVRPLLG